MRLDYTMYILGIVLLAITILPFLVQIEGINDDERNLWVILTVVLGVISIILGYSQRPKTPAQSCQIPVNLSEPKKDVIPSEKSIKKNIENKLEQSVIYEEKTAEIIPDKPDIELTKVKGIGEKRAIQLNALGIKTVNDLANESATNISKKLKISHKITKKWKTNAKKLLK